MVKIFCKIYIHLHVMHARKFHTIRLLHVCKTRRNTYPMLFIGTCVICVKYRLPETAVLGLCIFLIVVAQVLRRLPFRLAWFPYVVQ